MNGTRLCAVVIVVLIATMVAGVQRDAYSQEEVPKYAFVVVSDTHCSPGYALHNELWLKTIAQINSFNPDFVIHTGDINCAYKPGCDLFKGLTSGLECPIYYAPGNHDVGNKVTALFKKFPPYGRGKGYTGSMYIDPDELAKMLVGCVHEEREEAYEENMGPSYFSFDHEGDHFIILNSSLFNGEKEEGLEGAMLERMLWLRNQVEKQEQWLRDDLAAAGRKNYDHIFMFFHYPLGEAPPEADPCVEQGPSNYYNINQPMRKKLFDLIEEYNVAAVFMGHIHSVKHWQYKDTELYLTGGNYQTPGYRVVRVFADRIETKYVRTPLDVPGQDATDGGLVTTHTDEEDVFGFETDSIDATYWDVSGDGVVEVADGALHVKAEPGQGAVLALNSDRPIAEVEFRARFERLPYNTIWTLMGEEHGCPMINQRAGANEMYHAYLYDTAHRGMGEVIKGFPGGMHGRKFPEGYATAYRTYRFEATGKELVFSFDGKEIARSEDSHFITQLSFGQKAGPETVELRGGELVYYPQMDMYFDWIRVRYGQ